MLNITNQLIVSALFSLAGFILAMALTPIYTFVAYKYKFWKKQKTASVTGEALTVVNKLHAKKIARNIPTMAGIIGVIAVIIISVSTSQATGVSCSYYYFCFIKFEA